MESIFSDDLFAFIRTSEAMAYAVARGFGSLPSILREMERSVDVNSNVVIRQQYRSLRQSLAYGVSKTLDFVDLLKDILWLRQNQERWGIINKELENASSSTNYVGALSDKQSLCPHLFDLDNELVIRLEGLRKAHETLYSAYQQFEEDRRALLAMIGHSYTDMALTANGIVPTDLTMSSFWFAKNATLGVFAVGTMVLVLGLTGISPFCSRLISGIRIPLTIFFLACLAFGYRSLSRKRSSLEREQVRRDEAVSALNSVISEIVGHAGVKARAAFQMRSRELQVIRLSAEQFFSQSQLSKQIEANRVELQGVMNSLQ